MLSGVRTARRRPKRPRDNDGALTDRKNSIANNVPCAPDGIAPPPSEFGASSSITPRVPPHAAAPLREAPATVCLPPPPADGSSWNEKTSVARLAEIERRGGAETDADTTFAKNVVRLGSRFKNSEFSFGQGASAGVDEVDEMDVSMFRPNEKRRGQARIDMPGSSVRSRSPWWVGDGSFDPSSLLAAGEHVSLVLAPSARSICAGHTYLVPVAHAPSFAGCGPEVWDEVHRFRRCLRDMYAKEKMDVIFMETVTDSSGVVQARMDAVPVSKRYGGDAAMFFKNSLAEITDDWGTHTKVVKTGGRGSRGSVPKNFAYFCVDWDGGGYAQIIEDVQSFPKDFGGDTVAGMTGADPSRFGRRGGREAEGQNTIRARAAEFGVKWREFDWTGGIVAGKEERNAAVPKSRSAGPDADANADAAALLRAELTGGERSAPKPRPAPPDADANADAAALLRAQLMSGGTF